MKNQLFKLIFLLSFSTEVFGQNWIVNKSSVKFNIKHAVGFKANGTFSNFVGTIKFNTNTLDNSSIQGTIDSQTFNTGNSVRDGVIRGIKYFESDAYPKISMASVRFERGKSKNEFIGYFYLTIKNTRKLERIPFTFIENGSKGQLKSTFQVDRTFYQVGEKSVFVGDIVTLDVQLDVVR